MLVHLLCPIEPVLHDFTKPFTSPPKTTEDVNADVLILAVPGLKKQISRQISHPSRSANHNMPPENSNGATEHTSLLAHPLQHMDEHPLYKDERAYVRWPAYTARIAYLTLKSNYVNVLLVFVPLGIVAGAMGWNPTAVFLLNFFAIMPLASLLSFATEELSVKLGQTLGGLLNATFGNAVELIVSLHTTSMCMNTKIHLGQHCCSKRWTN